MNNTLTVCIGCGLLDPGPNPCAECCGAVRPAEVIDGRVYYTDGGCNEFGNLERIMLAPERTAAISYRTSAK